MGLDLRQWADETLPLKARQVAFLDGAARTEAGRERVLASFGSEPGRWSAIREANETLIACAEAGVERYLAAHVPGEGLRGPLLAAFRGPGERLLSLASSENALIAKLVEASGPTVEPLDELARRLSADVRLLKRVRRDLAALACPRPRLAVLGYGEISTVFELERDGEPSRFAYKKMPPFPTDADLRRYLDLAAEYHQVLAGQVGIDVPPFGARAIRRADGRLTLYDIQPKYPPEAIGNKVIHLVTEAECVVLLRMVLDRIRKLVEFNRAQANLRVALDAQISNWVVTGFDPARPRIAGDERLVYIDLSTPLMRRDGRELLDTELFLKSVPSFLVWLVRLAFLQQVLDRYYDPRLVVIDLIANFLKERRGEVIPALVEAANGFFETEMKGLGVGPISRAEVEKYYKNDAFIWVVFQNLRRLDRFIRTRLLGKPYEFRLPGKIKR